MPLKLLLNARIIPCLLVIGFLELLNTYNTDLNIGSKLNRSILQTSKPKMWPVTTVRISGSKWNNVNAQLPYLVYLPETNKLIMQFFTFSGILNDQIVEPKTMQIISNDAGYTWSERKKFPYSSIVIGLTNSGNGLLYCFSENLYSTFFKSTDNGDTWQYVQNTTEYFGTALYTWDPVCVINNSAGQKIIQIGYSANGKLGTKDYYSQPFIRTSYDTGNTWTKPRKIDNLKGYNEINVVQANNGDLVAACRRDPNPIYFTNHETEFDNYGGLAVSISKDEGRTWSLPKKIFEYGRHHPSMLLLNDRRTILMTYAVRVGGALGTSDNFNNSSDHYPYYGIEAIVSKDNGRTWEVKNRYVLSRWRGNIPTNKLNYFFRSSQSTSTVQMKNGTLLTAYSTGRYRVGGKSKLDWSMDINLLRWKR
ncbi:hypothetical protein QFZ20_004632 [Flavobacterium sp. W4I14]|nr:hypothetical protein [Flavobacterium sp. W4I14]